MASIEELRNARLVKINKLKDIGMNPYPGSVIRDFSVSEVKEKFEELSANELKQISIAGRVMVVRGQGSILFVVLQDSTGKFQAVLKKDELDEKVFNLFIDTVDNGDFITVSGTLFVTQRGEQSILIKDWKMATKALLPLPDKWHGLQDIEETYRKRYLDMIMDKEVSDRFIVRAKIIKAIREFFDDKNFIEVETPILQNQAGGAMAETFNTHLNDYDMDMVLRISLELEHKIIMAGGFERIYEIGKNFRNEGSDPTHMQEFSMIEWYAAYESLDTNIRWTEELIKEIALKVIGKTSFVVYDNEGKSVEVDLDGVWTKVTFASLLKENAGIDLEKISEEDLRKEAIKWGVKVPEVNKLGRGNLLDKIYKKSCREKIINPTFVTNFPGDLKPLAQQNSDGTAQVCQLIIAGAEITNQYAELVDPIKQRELLVSQSEAKGKGDEEAMEVDERFLEAMEHGMPPMTGFGMGIDRLVAILTEQKNLRDTVFFPIMKPREDNKESKKKETMIAVAVLNTGINLLPWQELNTVAHLNAAFGARVGKNLFYQDTIESKDNQKIKLNIKNAIMIKKINSSDKLKSIALNAKESELEVDEFTREMIETTNDKKVIEITSSKNFKDIEYLGVLIYGPKDKVDKITSDLEIY